jgi:hypothetical protein
MLARLSMSVGSLARIAHRNSSNIMAGKEISEGRYTKSSGGAWRCGYPIQSSFVIKVVNESLWLSTLN